MALKPVWRQRLRRGWFAVGGTLAGLAIVLAVLMALAQLLLPLLAHYPGRVASMLGDRLQQPVEFASMEGHWQPSGPLLVLHDVRIGRRDGKPALSLPEARVKLDFGALVWPSRHWVNLRLSGLKLTLLHDADGVWKVAGFGVGNQPSEGAVQLSDLPGNLWLDDLDLSVIDAANKRHYEVRAGPIRLSNDRRGLRFAGLLRRGGARKGLRVAGRIADDGARGRLWVAAKEADFGVMLADAGVQGYKVPSGQGDIALWLDWKQRRLTSLTANVDVRGLVVQAPHQTLDVPRLDGLLQYRRKGGHARILFAPGRHGAARIEMSGAGTTLRVTGHAKGLEPRGWLSLAGLVPDLPHPLGAWLATTDPRVHVGTAYVDWSRAGGLRALRANFSQLGFAATEGRPGVDDLQGRVVGDAESILLSLSAQPLTLDFGSLFRQPLAFSRVAGDVVMWHGNGGWTLATDGMDFKGDGLSGSLRGSARLPSAGGPPFLDMFAALDRIDVAKALQYLPVGAMSSTAVDWLDHGLISGSMDTARVVLHGSLGDWPFTDHAGRFEAHAELSGLGLAYLPDWPTASGIDVVADFVDNGMLVKASGGTAQGVKIKKAVASIPDFHKPELVLTATGQGKGGDLLQFVRSSPVGAPHAEALQSLTLGGQGDFDFSMLVPLAETAPDELTLAGKIDLHDAAVDSEAWNLHLKDLAGPLRFSGHGLTASGLTASYQGEPVRLSMEIGTVANHPDWPVKVNLQGRFTLAQLLAGRESLQALTEIGSGSADFDIGFHVDSSKANPMHRSQVLTVRSPLEGMALDLPVPLHKPASSRLPLQLQLGLPVDDARLNLWLGTRVYARARLPADEVAPSAIDVMLGGTAPSSELPDKGIRIRGHARHMDISGWVRHALSYSNASEHDGVAAIDVDLMTDNAEIFGENFKALHVQLHPESSQLDLAMEGPGIKGTASVPLSDLDKRGIVARFDRLHWPRQEEAAATDEVPDKRHKQQRPRIPSPEEAASVGVAPASLPPMHLWIGDLRFGDAHLGQARLETWPTGKGLHVDMLRTQSKWVHIAASGDWNGTADDSHTHMVINFSAKNLGKMLDAFGYEGVFVGGVTSADLDASWPGAPSSFDLANAEGVMKVDIGQGRVPEVKAGMGRLFGLMSITELPRRLSLDFGDVFGKGFGFDSMKGTFRFHDGNADTDDFTVKGSAADMSIKGRVGFRDRDYDQYVLAIPHVGNSLPVVGAVVGGPVGAAAGLAVQGLLGKGLNKAASARYHITGSWDEPQIKLVEKHLPEAAQPVVPDPAPALPGSTPRPAVPTRAPAIPSPAISSPSPPARGGSA